MNNQGKISFFTAVLMSINVMIGVGIYFNSQLMVQNAGTCSFLGWIAAAVLLLPVIWVTALAARIFPGEGGFYNYGKSGINETVGFISIWSYLVGYVGMVSAQVLGLTDILNKQYPSITQNLVLFNAVFIIALALFSMLSITWVSRIQGIATILKLTPLLLVIGLLYFYWDPQLTYTGCSYASLSSTISLALFGYFGFEACSNIGQYIKGGSQAVFKVILTAFFATTALYTLFHLGVLHIMGANDFATSGVQALPLFLGITSATTVAWINIIFGWILILSFSNAVYGNMLSNVTNLAGVAQRKLIFGASALTVLNRFDRPVLAVIVQCLATFLFITFVPNINTVVELANLAVVLTLALTTLSVLCAQVRQKSYLASIVTVLSFGSCGALGYCCWLNLSKNTAKPMLYIAMLIGVIGLGYAMFKTLRCCKSAK